MTTGHAGTPARKRQRTSAASPGGSSATSAGSAWSVDGFLSGVTVRRATKCMPCNLLLLCRSQGALEVSTATSSDNTEGHMSTTRYCAGLVQLFFVKRSFEMFAQRLKLWRPKLEAAGAIVTEVPSAGAMKVASICCPGN